MIQACPFCGERVVSRRIGLCEMHYKRKQRGQDMQAPSRYRRRQMTLAESEERLIAAALKFAEAEMDDYQEKKDEFLLAARRYVGRLYHSARPVGAGELIA